MERSISNDHLFVPYGASDAFCNYAPQQHRHVASAYTSACDNRSNEKHTRIPLATTRTAARKRVY